MTATGDAAPLAEALAAKLVTPTHDADDQSGREQSLAHGAAGVALLPRLAALLTHHANAGHPDGTGFLDGAAGLALAVHTTAHNTAPISGWDACLLIT